ncbi:MAG: tetratricopeptide repeat protein [Acidobacteriota bacterium]|nr:tetratricopeptide repeat protein [Acidobacteriota bacterium]
MRYTRQDLKQDKFAASAAEAIQEVSEHRTGIIRAVVALVVVVVLVGGGWWYCSSREAAASDALGRAMVTYQAPVVPQGTPNPSNIVMFNTDQDRLIAAKKAFYGISEQYGWTHSGQYARYLAAVSEEELGNYTVAEEQLRALTNVRHRDLAALAKYALAAVYRDEKRDADAINLLQVLIDKPSSSVPKATAEFALADLYEASHQNDKAKTLYNQITKDNPTGDIAQVAKSHLDGLN